MRLVVMAWASHTFLFGAGFRSLTRNIDAFQVPPSRGPIQFATKSFIQRAKRANNEVHFWTINEPGEMTRLIELGADGIVTDRVDLLAKLKHS